MSRNDSKYALDKQALEEAAASERAYHVLGVINDEQAFLSLVRSFDVLFGYHDTPSRTDAILKDKRRSHYFDAIVILCRETKLNIRELAHVADQAALARSESRKKKGIDPSSLISFLYPWCQYPDFEPEWHRIRRGDDKSLPTSRGKDLWGYLKGLYTDPEKVRLREPDYISQYATMYPGYEDCVKRARRAATDEMKRRYGDDVDLSPVTDLPKVATSAEQDFIDMLRGGSSSPFSPSDPEQL